MEIWNELAKLGIVFILMGFGMVMEWREILRLRKVNDDKDLEIKELNKIILNQERENTKAYKESNAEILEAVSDVTDTMEKINHTLITAYANRKD